MKNNYRFEEKVLSFYPKSTIVFIKKYYRFWQKVLSFLMKGTIVFDERINQGVQEEIKKET